MIESLNVGDLVRLVRALTESTERPAAHPLVGRYVIARGSGAGVHAGVLVSATPSANGTWFVTLVGARRLWSWTAKPGADKPAVALSSVAANGLASGRIDARIDGHALAGVVELIPCNEHARATIDAA